MKRHYLLVPLLALALSGCSATSALTGLIGQKPDITAQAGAENVKQTVGVTAKQDASSEQRTEVKDSVVGKVDSSARKRENATSITADTITADKIEVHNSDSGLGFALIGATLLAILVSLLYLFRKQKKEP
ncbi:RzlA [Klebsiella phage KMI8]|nr:RzlA [Klebsiella phage KMI8]